MSLSVCQWQEKFAFRSQDGCAKNAEFSIK